ncbi:MAG: YHYH protein [Planctomycetota bacterium]
MRGSACLFVTCLAAGPILAHPGHDDTPLSNEQVFYVAAFASPQNEVAIEVKGSYRYITSNGIPEHKTGRFPTRGNPNAISEQTYRYKVPAEPKVADKTTSVYGQPFGVALNGVPFDPGTAEVWSKNGRTQIRGAHNNKDLWNYDALSGKINLGIDTSNAHVQPSGAYHYHGIPNGLVALRKKELSKPAMVLVGYAADGFPVYSEYAHEDADDASSQLRKMKPSYRLKEGTRPGGDDSPGGRYDGTYNQDFEYVEGLGDLDACNGRTGVTPEYPDGTYYYVLTEDFPMIPRAFRGTPDESFERRRGGGRSGPPGGDSDRRRPPRNGDRPPPPRHGDRPPPR